MPKDPVILLSYLNTLLRDHYTSLSCLCDDKDEDMDTICDRLKSIGYVYDADANQFR